MNLQPRRDPTPLADGSDSPPRSCPLSVLLPHHTVPSHCSRQSQIQPLLLIIRLLIIIIIITVVCGEATFQHRGVKMRAEQEQQHGEEGEEEDAGVDETGRAGWGEKSQDKRRGCMKKYPFFPLPARGLFLQSLLACSLVFFRVL